MKLLVGTSKELVLVDGKKMVTLDKGDGQSFGITWSDHCVYVTKKGGSLGSLVRTYNKKFDWVKDSYYKHLADPHQAIVIGNSLWIANTKRNNLLEVGQLSFTREHNFGRKRIDVNHINSLWLRQDGALWVCLHNKHRKPRPYRSELRLLGPKKNAARPLDSVEHGLGCHNVLQVGNDLIFCSSNEYSLVRYDLKKRKEVQRFKVPQVWGHREWYTRGLAHDGSTWYVGMSMKAPREKRHESDIGGILELNDAWELQNIIPIKDRGQVNEIRIMDVPDMAHHGKVF